MLAPVPGTVPGSGQTATRVRQLHVTHLLMAGDVDGIGMHVLDLARAQVEAGTVRPLVVTSPSPEYARRLRDARVPYLPLRTPRLVPALLRAARRGVACGAADLTHLHGYRASHLLLAAASWPVTISGPTLVATCHGLPGGTLRRRARVRAELRSYRHLRLLITTSIEQAELVLSMPAHPTVSYVANGVFVPPAEAVSHDALARHGIPPAQELVGTVGRLASEKRHDVFLLACQLVAAYRPLAHFVLVGEGRERARLEALANQLGIADRVHFTGQVDDVPALCSQMSVLLHTADTEGTPRSVLEAMAAGVPVVATAVGGVPALVEDGTTGVLTPPRDAAAVAVAAVRLLRRPDDASRMGANGRARVVSTFTAQAMAARTETLYRQHVLEADPQ